MTRQDMEIRDFEAFGRIIIEWAKNPDDAPRRVGEFRDKVAENIVFLGGSFANDDPIDLFQAPPHSRLSLMLPHPDDLTEMPDGEEYPLPGFYQLMAFGGMQPNITDNNDFRSCRIADYVMRKCV